MKLNAKGQTSLEALMAAPLLVLFIFFAFVFVTSAKSFLWAQYQLHEAIICLQDQPTSKCKIHLKNQMKKYLNFWLTEDVRLSKGSRADSGSIIMTSKFYKKVTLQIEKRVHHE